MHAVHDEIRAIRFQQRRVKGDRRRVIRKAKLSANEHFHASPIRLLQLSCAGKIYRRIGIDGFGKTRKSKTVHFIVVIEMFGNTVLCHSLFFCFLQHFLDGILSVGRKRRMRMYVRQQLFHSSIIAHAGKNGNRRESYFSLSAKKFPFPVFPVSFSFASTTLFTAYLPYSFNFFNRFLPKTFSSF